MELLNVTLTLMAEQHLRGNILTTLYSRASRLKLLLVLLQQKMRARKECDQSE